MSSALSRGRIQNSAIWAICVSALFVFVVVGYPLVAFVPSLVGFGSTRPLSVAVRGLSLVASLAILIRWLPQRAKAAPIFLTGMTCFAILYVRRLGADATADNFALRLPWYEYWLFFIGSLLPAMAIFVVPVRYFVRQALGPLLFVVVLASVGNTLAALDALSGPGLDRFSHDALNPITMGHLGASLILLSSVQWTMDTPSRWPLRMGSYVWLSFGVILLVASGSRGPMLGATVALGFMVWSQRRRVRVMQVITVLSLLVGSVFATVVGVGMTQGAAIRRVTKAVTGGDTSLDLRLSVWKEASQAALNHPLLGAGLETQHEATYPHNVVIESFYATGLAGGVVFTGLFLFGMRGAIQLILERSVVWVGLLALQYGVGSLVSGSLYSNSQMWLMIAAAASVASWQRRSGAGHRHRLKERATGGE